MVDLDTDYNSFATQDNGEDALLNGNTELRIRNNAWKFIDFDYSVTSNAVIQFDFRSTIQGEIHGITLESDNTLSSNISFKVHGTQNWGIQDFDNYPNNGQWVTYTIDVGNFYTGTADRILFIADHDSGPSSGDSFFRNVTVFEDANSNGVCDGQESSRFDGFTETTPLAPIQGNVAVDEIGSLDFEIFPNPVIKGALSISLIGAEAQDLTIYNMLGQVVKQGSFENVVDVSQLNAGVYLLEITVGDDKMNKRFIKQ